MINEIRPQRITRLESTLVGDIDVSSINGAPLFTAGTLDETCVFFLRNNHSEVVGKYDDHDKVVEEMKQNYNATVKS